MNERDHVFLSENICTHGLIQGCQKPPLSRERQPSIFVAEMLFFFFFFFSLGNFVLSPPPFEKGVVSNQILDPQLDTRVKFSGREKKLFCCFPSRCRQNVSASVDIWSQMVARFFDAFLTSGSTSGLEADPLPFVGTQ